MQRTSLNRIPPLRSASLALLYVFGLVLAPICLAEPKASSNGSALAAVADDRLGPPFAQSLDRYCVECHNPAESQGGLDLEALMGQGLAEHPEVWEKAWRKLNTRQMPPSNRRLRPSEETYRQMLGTLADALDDAAAKHPNPGQTETFPHLTRFEYQNAIRDLLALDIDAAKLLPATESSHGFDHITVGSLSPALLTRYVSAAQKLSKHAVGSNITEPDGATYRVPPDVTQERHVQGLPLGTRGGLLVRHTFPRSGVYEIQVRLMRDRNDEVEGLNGTHKMEVLLDRERVAGFTIAKPKAKVANHFDDTKLHTRMQVEAGPREVGVTFIEKGSPVGETRREPLNVAFNLHRHPRLSPAVYQVSITGPYLEEDQAADQANVGRGIDTPSRARIFGTYPDDPDQHEAAAREILSRLAQLAYRRPVDKTDIDPLMVYYTEHAEQSGFESGIESALSMILTSPHFLFKIERTPLNAPSGQAYALNDFELASRLSFFLWSSIPDDELLNAAERGDLRQPDRLEAQVRRMLADEKAQTLATNFASQWLHLRNLDSITPDARLYPDFDENLRRAMQRETELFFMEMVRNDRSVTSLLKADHTYLNERLAKHYEVPHVYGSRFRRVDLPTGSERGGLLRHGSVLTVTSYATRTSPVIRGNWVLENVIGTPTPPPPPPDDVPSLDAVIDAGLSVRERLSQHRADAACASCHNLMDPIGFSLEQFDAVGRWREREAGKPVDAMGGLPNGQRFDGVAGLESGLLERPDIFVDTLTEKLLTYATARGITYHDRPAIRRIIKEAEQTDFRFSSIVLGIVKSDPFQMRLAP